MAELILVIAGSALGVVAVGKPVFGMVASVKPTRHIQYKYKKRQIKKQIRKAIEELDYDNFVNAFEDIQSFDSHFGSGKCSKYKKDYCVNNDIIKCRKLFKIRFDPTYLVEQCNNNFTTSSDELIEREQDLINKEKTLQSYEGFDALMMKEEMLKQKEEELKQKEEDIKEILKNYALLQ